MSPIAPRLLPKVLAEVNWKKTLTETWMLQVQEGGREKAHEGGRLEEGFRDTHHAARRMPSQLQAERKDSGSLILEERGKGREEKNVALRSNRKKEEQDNSTTEIKT